MEELKSIRQLTKKGIFYPLSTLVKLGWHLFSTGQTKEIVFEKKNTSANTSDPKCVWFAQKENQNEETENWKPKMQILKKEIITEKGIM